MANLSLDASIKLKKDDIKGYSNHVFRRSNDKAINHKNKEIDGSRTVANIDYDLGATDGRGATLGERLERRLQDYNSTTKTGKPRKLRSDAVLMRGLVLAPSSDVFEGQDLVEKHRTMNKFAQDAMPFITETFGGRENVMGMSAHLDETNPHLHVAICPMTADGRLSQKDFFKNPKQLAQMHRDFRKHMNDKGWDFETENKHEGTKHYSDDDYKRNAPAIEAARASYTEKLRTYQSEFDDLSEQREDVLNYERSVKAKANKLDERETALNDRESDLNEREADLSARELATRERALEVSEHQRRLDDKELALNKRERFVKTIQRHVVKFVRKTGMPEGFKENLLAYLDGDETKAQDVEKFGRFVKPSQQDIVEMNNDLEF